MGLEAMGGLPVIPRLHLEAAVGGGVTFEGSPWVRFGPRARVFVGDPSGSPLSLVVGGGGIYSDELAPFGMAGVALDTRRGKRFRARFQAEGELAYGSPGLLLKVGGVFQPKPRVTVAPVAEPPPATLGGEGVVWVPGPVCQWLPPDEASERFGETGLRLEDATRYGGRSVVASEGGEGAAMSGEANPEVQVDPARVVFTGSSADRVTVGAEVVAMNEAIEVAPGRLDVRVVGGGRSLDFPVAPVNGHGLWVPIPTPDSYRASFDINRVALSDTEGDELTRWIEQLGDWSVELFGSYSPEGDIDANRRLASKRASNVLQRLIEAGVNVDRVRVLEPQPPEVGLPPEQQRAAVLRPVEAL